MDCLHDEMDMFSCPVSGKILKMRCKSCGQEFESVAENTMGQGVFAPVEQYNEL